MEGEGECGIRQEGLLMGSGGKCIVGLLVIVDVILCYYFVLTVLSKDISLTTQSDFCICTHLRPDIILEL